MTTRRLITFDGPEEGPAPALWADCDDRGWNGFHVPTVTAKDFIKFFEANREKFGIEEWPLPFVDEDDYLRLPAFDAPDDREMDSIWDTDGRDSEGNFLYVIDGLVWIDAEPTDTPVNEYLK